MAAAQLASNLPPVDQLLLILAGALLGGFVLGLTGFGNGLAAYGIWLHVLPPGVGAPLVAFGSMIGHIVMYRGFSQGVMPTRIGPIIAGGLLGIPLGTYLLATISISSFKLTAGILLATYSIISLAGGLRITLHKQHWLSDAVAGFLGGICGGLASLSGPIMTLWCSIKGWNRFEQRATYQSYNFVMLAAAFISFALAGMVTPLVISLIAVTLPATLAGVWIGQKIYGRVDDEMFRKIVLALLSVSALALIWTNLGG